MQREDREMLKESKANPLAGFVGYTGTGDNGFGPAPKSAYGRGISLNGNRYSNAQGTSKKKDFIFRSGDVSYDGDVLVINSKKDSDTAKGYVDAAIESAKKAAKTNGTKPVDNASPEIKSLAQSVAALNVPEEYTASEMVAHIDNVRSMMNEIRRNGSSSAKDQMEAVMKNLNYDLEDFDSNLRIQVINDPSLIGQNDPNRKKIMDSSIQHVQSMSDEDILLSTLKYDKDSLQVGQEPGAVGTAPRYESPIEARLRELNEHKEAAIAAADEARSEFAKFAKEFAKDAIGVAADVTIGIPMSVASGLITMGVSSSSKDGDIFSFDTFNAGLAGMSLGSNAYDSVKNKIEKVGSIPVNMAKSVANEISRAIAANQDEDIARDVSHEEASNISTDNTSSSDTTSSYYGNGTSSSDTTTSYDGNSTSASDTTNSYTEGGNIETESSVVPPVVEETITPVREEVTQAQLDEADELLSMSKKDLMKELEIPGENDDIFKETGIENGSTGEVTQEQLDDEEEITPNLPPEINYEKPKITGFTVKDSSTEGQVIVTVRVEPGYYDIIKYSFKSDDRKTLLEKDAIEGQLTYNIKVPKGTRMTFEVYDGKARVSTDITAV